MTGELEQFFRAHFPILRGKCARVLGDGDEAADVAQEAFMRLCESPVVHQPAAARLKWMYVTGTRLCIDRLRRRQLGIETRGAGAEDGAPSPTAPADAALAARQSLHFVAAALPVRDLEVVILSRCDEMTQDEIAATLDLSARQVRRILVRSEAQLARLAAEVL